MRAKTQIELNLAWDIKDNKKTFYRFFGDKRKIRKNVGPLQKEKGDLVMWDMEEAVVLNNSFALFFTNKCSTPHAREGNVRDAGSRSGLRPEGAQVHGIMVSVCP